MLALINPDEIADLVALRTGETKIGESTAVGAVDDLAAKGVKFVILGVQESIGPKANLGNRGAENAWMSFLKAFVNIQDNQFIDVTKVGILGSFKYDIEDFVKYISFIINLFKYLLSILLSLSIKSNNFIEWFLILLLLIIL